MCVCGVFVVGVCCSEVKETDSEIAKKRLDRLQMRSRLQDMEAQIMHSTKQIDEAKKHDLAIKQKQLEIERQRVSAHMHSHMHMHNATANAAE